MEGHRAEWAIKPATVQYMCKKEIASWHFEQPLWWGSALMDTQCDKVFTEQHRPSLTSPSGHWAVIFIYYYLFRAKILNFPHVVTHKVAQRWPGIKLHLSCHLTSSLLVSSRLVEWDFSSQQDNWIRNIYLALSPRTGVTQKDDRYFSTSVWNM